MPDIWARLRNFTLRDGRIWLAILGGDTWAGKPVTPNTAMQVATVWACVRLVSQTCGTLPIGVYRKTKDGGREQDDDHALAEVLRGAPNADQTPAEFIEGMVACLLLYGNAFAEKTVTAGQVRALTILHPELMTVRRLESGALQYVYTDATGRRTYSEDEIWHLKGFGLGGDLGLSPIAYARQTIGTAVATDEAAARTFANGMRPGGFFNYEGKMPLTPEQREQARKVLIEPYQGAENAGRIGILEAAAGFKWQDVMIPPRDAEMLGMRNLHIEEICRWYGVPPILVGHAPAGQTMWGSGVEQIMLGWLTLGLRPYLTRIEQSIRRSLIAPAERKTIYAEFNVEGLLRGDSAGRAKFFSTMVQNGLMTRNEGRRKENLPEMEGGNALTVQSNLLPIELLGKVAPSLTRQREDDGGA
jgi:HK97 family phage portal protein